MTIAERLRLIAVSHYWVHIFQCQLAIVKWNLFIAHSYWPIDGTPLRGGHGRALTSHNP